MKTCYDCIHCEACSDAGDEGFSSLKEDVSKCKHFKNKADFVEVVRCSKCKHKVEFKERTMCSRTAKSLENMWLGLVATDNDHYCGYGEKRSDT